MAEFVLLITGASGSGTTTLGRALAEHYAVTHLDTDDYYWLPADAPFTQKRSPEERLELILRELGRNPRVVISGSIMTWGLELENAPHLIVYLSLETRIRIERLIRRETERFGAVDPDFIEWASLYDAGTREGRSREKHTSWLARRACPIILLDGDLSVSERLARLAPHLNGTPLKPKQGNFP